MAAKVHQGRACAKCGCTTRYVSTDGCVACTRARAAKSAARTRKPKEDNWGYGKEMPVPSKPNRKGWPGRYDFHGETLYPDPIVHLGLDSAGKFE